MDYGEIVKGLPSEKLLHQGRKVLIRAWQEMPNDRLTLDALSAMRELMKRVVRLENPDFDAEELEGVVEPEGNSIFDQED